MERSSTLPYSLLKVASILIYTLPGLCKQPPGSSYPLYIWESEPVAWVSSRSQISINTRLGWDYRYQIHFRHCPRWEHKGVRWYPGIWKKTGSYSRWWWICESGARDSKNQHRGLTDFSWEQFIMPRGWDPFWGWWLCQRRKNPSTPGSPFPSHNPHRTDSQEGQGEPQVSRQRTWVVCVLEEEIAPLLEGGISRSQCWRSVVTVRHSLGPRDWELPGPLSQAVPSGGPGDDDFAAGRSSH